MEGLMTLMNWVMNMPRAMSDTGINSAMQWIGTCMQGACTSYPQTVWNNIGDQLSKVTSVLSSSAAALWSDMLFFLPDGGQFPSGFHEAAIYFGNALQSVSFIVPVAVLIECMAIVFTVKITLWSFHILRVIVSFFRGVSVENYRWHQ